MTRAQRCVVAVDGPSGSGKSTVSRRLAASLRASYLDTGAMYRAVTWAVLRSGVDAQDADAVAKVAAETELRIGTDPGAPSIHADGVAVDVDIRGPEVTAAVSAVASVPAVRRLLVARQRELIVAAGRIVVEGRDIGTVVAPDADLKVYLTASAAERARRRSAENAIDVASTAADLARRDRLDSTRTADPLRQADDAVVLDTTELGIDEVVARLRTLLDSREAPDGGAGVAVGGGADGPPDGSADGALDGDVDRALDGDVDRALDGDVDRALDGGADGVRRAAP